MTVERDNPDEHRLRELFDATAESASGPTLTKLGARARDAPQREQRLPRWLPRWAWSPTLAGLAVASGAAIAGLVIAVGGREPPDRPLEQVTAPVAERSASARPRALDDPLPSEFLELEANGDRDSLELAWDWEDDLAVEMADFELDPGGDPGSDFELDAWLFATGEILKEGG